MLAHPALRRVLVNKVHRSKAKVNAVLDHRAAIVHRVRGATKADPIARAKARLRVNRVPDRVAPDSLRINRANQRANSNAAVVNGADTRAANAATIAVRGHQLRVRLVCSAHRRNSSPRSLAAARNRSVVQAAALAGAAAPRAIKAALAAIKGHAAADVAASPADAAMNRANSWQIGRAHV